MSQVWAALMWTLLALIDDLWLTLTLLSFHSFYTETAMPWLYKFKVFILSQFGLLCSAENVNCYIWTMRDTSSDPGRLQVSRFTIASKYKHLPLLHLNTVSQYKSNIIENRTTIVAVGFVPVTFHLILTVNWYRYLFSHQVKFSWPAPL